VYAPIQIRFSTLASSLHYESGMKTKCPLPKGFSGTRRVSGVLFSIVALSLIAASAAVAAPFAYISNFGSANVSVIDAGATASCGGPNQVAPPPCVVATVPVGSFPGGVAVNPAGTFAYVANQDDGTVSVIRTSDNTVVGGPIPVGVQPWGVAVTADNALVYVGLGNGGVAVIDANNGNSVSVISGVGGLLNGIVTVGSRVFVSDATAGQVVVIQGTSVVARIDVGSPPNSLPMGLVANSTGTRVYVVDLFLDPNTLNSVLEVSPIDTTSNPMRVTTPITIDPNTMATPGGIALSPDGSTLYVTSDAIDRLHIVTLSNGSVVSVPVGDSPVGVATDPDGRIYVGNAGAGTVTVFDASYNPITRLPAPKTVRVGSTPFVFGAFTTAGPPAPPPPAQFVLSLTTVGSGTISANPQPVSGTYTAGTVVSLAAVPATNFQFTGWSGACSGTSACSVTMDAAKSVTATFTLKQFALVLATIGSGTITASPLPVGGTYGAGTVVSLTANPAANFQFTGWSGACSGSSSCNVTMDATKSVTATFTLKQFALTLATVGSGTITANPSPVNGTYGAGTVVALTAAPASGSQFSGWSGACSGTGACSVTMDAAKSVTATFAALPPPPPQQFTLTLTSVGDGSIAPQPAPLTPAGTAALALAATAGGQVSGKYNAGTIVTLTPVPAAGFRFSGWSGACSGTGTCSVTMNAAKSVTATFTAVPMTCDDKISDLQKKVAGMKHPWWHDHQLKLALKMYAESLAELNRAKAKVGANDKRYVHAKKEFDNGKAALCLGHYWRADHEFWETYVIAHEILKPNRR
jgi:YVTN family beta-propeller protein